MKVNGITARSEPDMTPEDAELAQVLEAYLEAREAGRPLPAQQLLAEHPRIAERLKACLASLEAVEDVAGRFFPGEDGESEPRELGCLGDYRLLREVGRGGMGIVYEAQQLSLGRRVALKVLPFAATMDPRQLQRFRNEAQAAASLEHPHIVPVYFVGSERGVHYYTMQFIDGRTLAQVIAQYSSAGEPTTVQVPGAADTTPRPVATEAPSDPAYFRRVAEWGVQAAEALEHAHTLGVVHRDVKPGNLMIDGQGHLWITDFGLARRAADSTLTRPGDLLGTLRYMSPEQALAGHGLVDPRTDIYSLGASLYELLALEPVLGAGKDREAVLHQIAFEEPKAPRRINKSIPAELETIVLKALEKNPADRYPTAQALAEDLRRYLTNQPIRARRPSLVQRARKVAQRHPGATVTAAVAVVVGLLLGMAGLAVNNRMVRQEQRRTKDALDQAEQEKAIARAVRAFLNKLLIQADPRAQADALRRAGDRSTGLKPTPTIRELLDRAASELAPDRIEDQFPNQPLVQAELLKTIGEAYSGIGNYGPAISHLVRARELHARELGYDHPDTLATTQSLGRVHLANGKFHEAARLFELVHNRRSEALGPNHPDTLASMSDLVRAYYKLGWRDRSLALREEILRLRVASLGGNHPDTLASRSQLANSYAALRQNREALQLHQETMAVRKRNLGEDDPDTLESMNNLAICHYALGHHDEALKLHQETLERRRSTLGPDDLNTLQSMNNVAVACAALGRHEEARKLYQETLARRNVKLRRDHQDRLQSMNALAWLLANCPDRTLRDPGKALELAMEVVLRAPATGEYWNTLGATQYRAGDWKSAVGTLTRSMELRKGGDAADWFFLAMAHWHSGDRAQARTWYDRALQWLETNRPEDEELRCFRAEAADLLGIDKQ
jgi:serine/threonine protein kinase